MISRSASRMLLRMLASVLPRQSVSSAISSSINAEADSTGTRLFIYSSNSRTEFRCGQHSLQPPQATGGPLNPLNPGFGLNGDVHTSQTQPARQTKLSSCHGDL